MAKCLACGIEKNPAVFEKYPYEEDNITTIPVPPLFEIDCQPSGKKVWKKVIVCHKCYHALEPDMWISEHCWKGINPITPFEQLPNLYTDEVK